MDEHTYIATIGDEREREHCAELLHVWQRDGRFGVSFAAMTPCMRVLARMLMDRKRAVLDIPPDMSTWRRLGAPVLDDETEDGYKQEKRD